MVQPASNILASAPAVGPFDLQSIALILVLAGAGTGLLWAYSRFGPGRIKNLPGRRQEHPARPVDDPNARDAAALLAADLSELTERLAARMDEKAARLESLLARADERLAALEEAEARAASPARRARRTRSGASTEPKATSRAAGSESDATSRRIYELADGGKEPAEIATALGEPIGKVELILALRAS